MLRSEPFAAIVYWSHNYTYRYSSCMAVDYRNLGLLRHSRPEATHYKYNVTVIRTWRTEDIMAIKKEKKAPQVTEIPEVSNYKEDLKEIKEILKELLGKLNGITGG